MRIHAIERCKGVFQSSPLVKANQRLVLCIPALLQCPVVESISGAGQPCVRCMPTSALTSELCTVKALEGPKNLSALQNSEVSAFGSTLSLSASIRTASSGPVSKVAVPLYSV